MHTKPFQTLNQQMKILRERGLEVPTKAKRSLERNGYYSIINGYKLLFLARNSSGEPLNPEKYITGATFQEIQSLYEFDKELRGILYDSLSVYESTLSSTIAYRFSEEYPDPHSYLALENYTQDPTKIKQVVQTISRLSGTISNKADKDTAIKHYVNHHRHVPLWVLVNFLTFGDFNYLFKIMTDPVRIRIAKDFKNYRNQTYKGGKQYNSIITPQAIDSINKVVNQFRNSVAHGEVTFSKKLYKPADMRPIKSALELNNPTLSYDPHSKTGVFELLLCLKVVLDKQDFQQLNRKLEKLIDKYKSKFISIDFDNVLSDMNFPTNYSNILSDHI